MPRTLSDAIQQLRIRSGIQVIQNTNTFDPTGNGQLAIYLNEAQHFFGREAVTLTAGAHIRQNKGWYLKKVALTPVSGELFLPPDVEVLIGVSESATSIDRVTALKDIKLIGGCDGEYVRRGDVLEVPTDETDTQYVVYNSNLRDHWVAGTVSSASSTTLVSTATPSYSYIPFSDFDDYYNGLLIRTTSTANGTQTARITDYTASTRTFTVAAWPSYTPSSGDTWSTLNRVEDDELLMYHAMSLAPEAQNWDRYRTAYEYKREAFFDSVHNRHGYQQ